MEPVVPWEQLLALTEPHAPVAKTGRPPFTLAAMLRIHFMQQWFGLSGMAMQKALFGAPMHRHFAGLDGMTRLPRRVSILRFRHLLEQHRLAAQFLATVNQPLAAKGCPCCADQGLRPLVSHHPNACAPVRCYDGTMMQAIASAIASRVAAHFDGASLGAASRQEAQAPGNSHRDLTVPIAARAHCREAGKPGRAMIPAP
jgi:hypothetical protein